MPISPPIRSIIVPFITFLILFIQATTGYAFTPEPVPGGVAAVDLGPATPKKPVARFGNKRVIVIDLNGHWTALVGLPLNILPGSKIISVRKADKSREEMVTFKVEPKTYPEQRIKIKETKYVSPNKKQLARINRESSHIKALFKIWRDTPTIPLLFDWPVKGRLSSPFGLKRFFNDKPRKPHSGIDIAAPEGTDILAPLPGEVIDTGNYYFNGNTVFVDHGQGMISMFCHMSKISVKKGETLTRGQKIGEVGMTGRVTGPHLHWSLSLNENRVDPMLFLPPHKDSSKKEKE